VLPLVFTTHILVPSKATPTGPLPTLNVPIFVPSLARSFGHGVVALVPHPDIECAGCPLF
jgi:hypothetical protein